MPPLTGAFKKKGRGKLLQPTGASHVIVQPNNAPQRLHERQPRAGGGGSILSRIGTPGSAVSGTAVSFENLNFDIMKDDIGEFPSRLVA